MQTLDRASSRFPRLVWPRPVQHTLPLLCCTYIDAVWIKQNCRHIRQRIGWLLTTAESIEQFVQIKNDSTASPFKTLAISENGGEGTMVGWTYGSLELGSGLAQGIKWTMN